LSAPLRIATRRSKLALWQARHVAGLLRQAHAGLDVEILELTTQGDRIQDRALADVGGKGLFVKELELALLENRADIAVHSMKDVPSSLPPELVIAAALARANPRDAFVSLRHRRFADLPVGAAIGTSSPRRQSQLRAARGDLEIRLLRGNVDTRLTRLADGSLDAIVLACAGLERLGLEDRITEVLSTGLSVPAVGQGVIGVEARVDDVATRGLVAALDHADTHTRLRAERAFAQTLQGSCHSPIAAYAETGNGRLHLIGYVGAPDGIETYRAELEGDAADAAAIGRELAQQLSAAGAGALLERLRSAAAAMSR
jgi:hydroxymethylbilane synthase